MAIFYTLNIMCSENSKKNIVQYQKINIDIMAF